MKSIRKFVYYLRSIPARFEAAVDATDPDAFIRACDHVANGVVAAVAVTVAVFIGCGLLRYFMAGR